jgi:MYXO-CTERM domain-containing protein
MSDSSKLRSHPRGLGSAKPGGRRAQPSVACSVFAGCVAAVTLWAPGPVWAAPPDVTTTKRVPLRSDVAAGVIEHRVPSLEGLPVRGAFEVLHRGHDGTTRVVSSRALRGPPQFLPHEVRIPSSRVAALIAEAAGTTTLVEPEEPPTLVYLSILGHAVLAWEVQLPLTFVPEPSRRRLWVSAMTGRVLDETDEVRSSRAHVFAANPSATPEPIEVELDGLDVHGPGLPLDGDRLRTLNCSATQPAEVLEWWNEGQCYPVALAKSDKDGDFFVPLPNIVYVDDNIDPEDLYAEVSMYYHGARFLDELAQRGLTEFSCETSTLLANHRGLAPDGDLDFTPVNNAYYTNQCDPERGPTMIFGQGSEVDFGYDGDVVYHELGHGVVALVAPEGLTRTRLRPDASVFDAGGVNEALADYFSAMITGNPHLGNYVGRFWSGTSRPWVRTAENQKTCPRDTIGQVHNDGEPMMAALWATRLRVGRALDAIVLQALARMPGDATLEEASHALIEVSKESVKQGAIDETDHDVLVRALESRGLLDCPRVITDPDDVAAGRTMWLRQRTVAVRPFYPGPMQLRYEVPPGQRELWVSFRLRPRGSSDPVSARVLVKRSDHSVEFEYDLVAVDDPGDPTGQTGRVREVVLVSGDWDLEVEPERVAGDDYVARVTGLEPGEVVHVAVVNDSPTPATASNVWIGTPGAVQPESDDDGDDDGGEREPATAHAEGAVSSGCGCSGGAPAMPLASAMLALLVGWRRRWRGWRS